MEENNRVNRRSRPRPYDLRRKVLLKNFLREQMTHIPVSRIELMPQNNGANFPEESVVSNHVEDLPVVNDDSSTSNGSSQDNSILNSADNNQTDDILSNSNEDVKDTNNSVSDTNSSNDSVSETSTMFKIAGLVKLKRESKKKIKGIFKAKDVRKNVKSPIKTRSFKSGLERVFYGRKKPNETSSASQMSKSSPRSLFSLFKHRRDQRHAKIRDRTERSSTNFTSPDVSGRYSTINQSVQTDDSWVREDMRKVQQSNRLLKEENRLLSQSLSYFMSSASMDPHVMHNGSPLQSSNKNVNSMVFPDYYIPPSNTSRDNWNSRPRVSRSKSVHEYSERKLLRNNYRTRSMNFHDSQNFSSTNTKPPVSMYSTQTEMNNITRRRNAFANVPLNNSVRNIQRRSSLPERTFSENNRSMVCRRSGSVRDIRNRRPFHTLSADAFY